MPYPIQLPNLPVVQMFEDILEDDPVLGIKQFFIFGFVIFSVVCSYANPILGVVKLKS